MENKNKEKLNPDGILKPKMFIERNSEATSEQTKSYIGAGEYQAVIWRLMDTIKEAKFKPDIIIFLKRGGADIALYASHLLNGGKDDLSKIPFYEIEASYRDWDKFFLPQELENILKQKSVKIKQQDKTIKNVLIVDDICDTGAVLDKVREILNQKFSTLTFKFGVAYAREKSKHKTDFYGETASAHEWLEFHYTLEYKKYIENIMEKIWGKDISETERMRKSLLVTSKMDEIKATFKGINSEKLEAKVIQSLKKKQQKPSQQPEKKPSPFCSLF